MLNALCARRQIIELQLQEKQLVRRISRVVLESAEWLV